MQTAEDLAKAIVVTAEMLGQQLSPAASTAMAMELARENPEHVALALRRCSHECRGRLTLADILERLPGAHPGANEAWALCPTSEDQTVVWTNEIARAWNAARGLFMAGDTVAARMAFIDAYKQIAGSANARGMRAEWSVSLGWSREGRRAPILEAVERGRLTVERAAKLLPPGDDVRVSELLLPGELSASIGTLLERMNPKVKA